ncbi:motility associated factor glycosyltransferase family protein [Campylobacter upsaliensis]|uniref:motility associated factor glycosyltransferase family protein n=1 Tax=Campylobacter upsaliensis TaxID=28080 RepID=UPI002B3B4DF0|nr:motility associated factor glycosyltransferase family protein [Campylobacter upsaliensis]MEB2811295.1 motility associated factor glycosyltransferase family protein [Campylobacter upsaliensis]MEB2822420.1 motility associated factor glycosyltransferase family protein [Campylobacter upsaliensis]
MQEALFNANLNALKNPLLKQELLSIKESKFKLIVGKNELDVNLLDEGGGGVMYQNPLSELKQNLEHYTDKFALYPVLYFYGFGNGLLFKALLQNPQHKHLVVFERELEILYTIFHYIDFSKELAEQKILLFNANTISAEELRCLCYLEPFFSYARVYFLELCSDYYEKFSDDIIKLNQTLLQSFTYAICSQGNDPLDSLQGIEQFILNLPFQLTRPNLKEFLEKRRNISKTAIIVSTGPSLMKQLPLLKEYREKALIFCADSAYPILAKHNIKPDFVCMVERSDFTAEFFKHDFGDFDEGICFVLVSLVHPNATNYLKNKNCVLINKTLYFADFMGFRDYDFEHPLSNVACMAYSLACELGAKNIILIGQDLAYDENGFSHPKDYQHGQDFESESKKFSILAYGGKGEVLTHTTWLLFKQNLEDIILRQSPTCYNATEGGARIEHCIEKSFKQCCEELLKEKLKRPFPPLTKPTNSKELLQKASEKIALAQKHSNEFQITLSHFHKRLQEEILKLESVNLKHYELEILDEIQNSLSHAKEKYYELFELLSPYITQFKLNLARILVLNPKTLEDQFNKNLILLQENLKLIEFIFQALQTLDLRLENALKLLENAIKENQC